MLHNKFWQAFFALAPILMLVLFFIGYFVFLFSLFSSLPELETTEGLPPSEFFGSLLNFSEFHISESFPYWYSSENISETISYTISELIRGTIL